MDDRLKSGNQYRGLSQFQRRGGCLKPKLSLTRKLNTFDVASLVVGSIIGADIYVAAALGARLVGPASIVVWVVSGAIAIVIALSFAHCATLMPRVGGPFAYATAAQGPFAGFLVGWGMLLAEWFSLAVFPVAFAQYAVSLVPGLGGTEEVLLKGVFVLIVLVTNVLGIKAAGRFNDGLTIAKLGPLLILILAGIVFAAGHFSTVESNFQPFFKGGLGDYGQALVLIFWAYAGFELATLPADEIERPEKTIPRSIVLGMLVVMVFYLATNFVILAAMNQESLASSSTPLMDASKAMFPTGSALAGAIPVIIGLGALISILGADESGTIGTSRLAFAMSVEGLLPRSLSRLHGRYRTPYIGLVALCLTALIVSIVGGLNALISASVFLLAFGYFATCASTLRLQKMRPEVKGIRGRVVIPAAGMLFSLLLMGLVDLRLIGVSLAMIAVGVPVYLAYAPKGEVKELKEAFLAREAVLRRTYEQGERFLALPWRRGLWLYYKLRKSKKPWVVQEEGSHD